MVVGCNSESDCSKNCVRTARTWTVPGRNMAKEHVRQHEMVQSVLQMMHICSMVLISFLEVTFEPESGQEKLFARLLTTCWLLHVAAAVGFGTCFIKNNRFFSIGFSKITGYSDYYFSK